MLRLQCVLMPTRTKIVLNGVPADMPIQGLQLLVQEKLGVPVMKQCLFEAGMPPRLIDTTNAQASLSSLGICDGYRLDVHTSNGLPKTTVSTTQGGGGKWKFPPTIQVHGGGGRFERITMPSDNSCLFHSIGFVCQPDKAVSKLKARKLRQLVASLVAADPRTYGTTFLGMTNVAYQEHILHPNMWGGAIELSIFARHFHTEIVAFDPGHLREDIYQVSPTEDSKISGTVCHRVFILYVDGRHYDAMAWSGSNGEQQVVFSTRDTNAWARARDFCQSLHADLVRQGKCVEQTQWRTNRDVKCTRTADLERAREMRVARENEAVQVVNNVGDVIARAATKQSIMPLPVCRSCSRCSFDNDASAVRCAMCNHTETSTESCNQCTCSLGPNPSSVASCPVCDSPNPGFIQTQASKTWSCQHCTSLNIPSTHTCHTCRLPRR